MASCYAPTLGQTASWRSTTSQSKWVNKGALSSSAWSSYTTRYFELFPDSQYQVIEGVGGCFNEKGWDALSVLSQAGRDSIIRALFDVDGCNMAVGRLPIGANDFADGYYSLNDNTGDYAMDNFNITRDRTKIIPFIKAAMAYQPDMRIWASPWTPPQWMKTTGVYSGAGHLTQDAQTLGAYALYLSKAVSAFQAEGINLTAISPQNEPTQGNGQTYPSCVWSPAEYLNFYKNYLVPRFQSDNVKADLMLGTYCVGSFQDWVQTIMSDPIVSGGVSVLGFQQVISPTGTWAKNAHTLYPTKRIYETETNCCHSNDWAGGQTEFTLLSNWFKSFATVYSEWNMVLDETGLSNWGWKQAAMITVNKTTKAVTYNPHFYAVKHFSNFIKPGTRPIKLVGHDNGYTGSIAAFRNPGGDLVVTASGSSWMAYNLVIKLGTKSIKASLPANSFNTFVITQPPAVPQAANPATAVLGDMHMRNSTLVYNASLAAGFDEVEFVLSDLKGARVWSEHRTGAQWLASGARPTGISLKDRGIPAGTYFLVMNLKAAGSRPAATVVKKVSVVY
jgi:glucosylceramidase